MREKPRWLKVLLIVVAVIVTLVLLLAGAAIIWLNSKMNMMPRLDENPQALSSEEAAQLDNETDPIPEGDYTILDPEEITMPERDAQVIEDKSHIVNILLVGQDSAAGIRSRSDTMILCTLDTSKKTLVMTSFLRDLYVDLPDYQGVSYEDNRLNTCYMFGGHAMLNEAMLRNFGVHVDHNVVVDFSSFPRIVDAMGGVGICLTQAEANIVGGGAKADFNILNGQQALNYARIRSIDSDFNRTNRQRTVLLSLLEQVRYQDLDSLNHLADVICPMLHTDMSNSEMMGYLAQCLPMLPELKVTTQRIPIDGAYTSAYVRGMAVLIPDFEANRKFLRDTLG